MAEASTGSNGSLRMRTVSGPLRRGVNLPKGALNVIFGNHSTCVRRSARSATASGRTPSTN
jgi:hypothetical protein